MHLLDGTDFFYCAKMAESSLSHAISKEELIDEPCLLLHRCWESLYAGKCLHQNCGWRRDGGRGSCCYINGGQ